MICYNYNDLCSDERCYCARAIAEQNKKELDLIDLQKYIEKEKQYGK